MVFSVCAHPVARDYTRHAIIPALCGKVGVPTADVRGTSPVTGHAPHRQPALQRQGTDDAVRAAGLAPAQGPATQHYAKITPNTPTKAYTQARYFARTIRTIEVLLDRDAVASGTAADGQPWHNYDLGHGYCS
jgi:hypothetical protein